MLSAAVPIARKQIAGSRASLLFLAYLLRSPEHVHPRGVAIVQRLVSDGGSALYAPSSEDAVELQVQAALDFLVGERRADPEVWFEVSNVETRGLVGSA
jgi:hypothetical protein